MLKRILRFRGNKNKWFSEGSHDPKTTYFKDIIQKKLKNEPERKIVVFTEFADTADYLYKSLKDDIRVFKYSAEDSSEKINRLSGEF